MNTREEFGSYLLLKKLTDDPLGETFRAGRLGKQGLDQVVLLRVLNGAGLDTERLWTAVAERQEVQKALKSPNIGSGVDAGTVRGVPYVAYDYISGKDLATLIDQAARENSPFPTDHALLIADRIGLALTAAYEARHAGERVLHGMVAPPLVMVSNEGETRLLGFEAGGALAAQAAVLPDEVKHYLAPEARSGAAPSKKGDVFSLGAILFELLTGKPLPEGAVEDYAAIVDQARLAAESAPLPAGLAELLKRSLAPAESRIADASAWHKGLSRLMSEGGYNATTFNLAFFMHNLFREEIERESREIEVEKTMEIPTRGASVGAIGAETRALSHEEVARAAAMVQTVEDTGTVRERYGIEETAPEGGGKKGLWIGLAAAVVIVGGAVAAYFLTDGFGTRQGASQEPAAQTAQMEEPAAQPEAEPAQPQGPTPEEIQAQIDSMLEEKTQAGLANIKEEYDQRIADMQRQLQAAEDAAQERERRLAEAEKQAKAARERGEAEEQAAAQQEEQAQKPAARTTLPAEPAPNAAGTTGAAGTETQQASETGARETAQRQSAKTVPAQPEPQAPKVKVGDLVKPGPGVIQPRVVRRAAPSFPPVAARLNREATVDVQVLVDENGHVLEATIQGKRARFGFDDAALDAARKSVFEPAEKDGVRVRMWTTIRFVFKR